MKYRWTHDNYEDRTSLFSGIKLKDLPILNERGGEWAMKYVMDVDLNGGEGIYPHEFHQREMDESTEN